MSPEVQSILEITGIAWLFALLALSFVGVVRLARNGRNNVDRPRREVFRWMSDSASQVSTGAALLALMVYFFSEWFETSGLIISIVYSVAIVIGIVVIPTLARKHSGSGRQKKGANCDDGAID